MPCNTFPSNYAVGPLLVWSSAAIIAGDPTGPNAPGRATEIDEPSLGRHDQALTVGKYDFVDLGLDLLPGIVAQGVYLDISK